MHPEGVRGRVSPRCGEVATEADDIQHRRGECRADRRRARTLLAILKAAAEDDVVQWHDGPLLKAAREAIATAEGRR